jgi:hypothetical protein
MTGNGVPIQATKWPPMRGSNTPRLRKNPGLFHLARRAPKRYTNRSVFGTPPARPTSPPEPTKTSLRQESETGPLPMPSVRTEAI